jgi:hypothetical protein
MLADHTRHKVCDRYRGVGWVWERVQNGCAAVGYTEIQVSGLCYLQVVNQ